MRYLRLALVGALTATLLPLTSAAAAEQEVVIKGRGWGHGIGMSQYGAYGRARNGHRAEDILEHYYSGSNVRTGKMPRRIRVGMHELKGAVTLTSSARRTGGGKMVFKEKGSGTPIFEAAAGERIRAKAASTGGVKLWRDGTRVKRGGRVVFGSNDAPVRVNYQKHGTLVRAAGKGYGVVHGRLELVTYPSDRCTPGVCISLVLAIPMQKYLYGLGEVPASWPAQALRTQVIAARTYAFEKVDRSGQNRYPCFCAVYDSTLDQVYSGDSKRTSSGIYWDDWKGAVDSSKDLVILYGGSPIQAFYSSSSGGYTEGNANVWGGTQLPYLRGVSDRADYAHGTNPNYRWKVSMPYSSFEQKLNGSYGTGAVKSFELVKPYGVSGRVTVVKSPSRGGVRIVGSNKTVRASGWSIRSALGLKDSWFRVTIETPVGARFAAKYERLGGAPGDARSDPYDVPKGSSRPKGRAQNFERGRMTWVRSTDKTVWQWGRVLHKYNRLGREKSALGMPKSNVWGKGFKGAGYSKGMILWSKGTGARTVRGGFATAYRKVGAAKGSLGLPLAERKSPDSLPRGGRLQRFESGSLYKTPGAGVFALWGKVERRYRRMGEAASGCGYPTADSTQRRDGTSEWSFESGTIRLLPDDSVEVACS